MNTQNCKREEMTLKPSINPHLPAVPSTTTLLTSTTDTMEMGRNGQLSHLFFPSFIFLFFFNYSFQHLAHSQTEKICTNPPNPLQYDTCQRRPEHYSKTNSVQNPEMFITLAQLQLAHKDHCTILSVDTAARRCSILRALHSTKEKSVLKNNVFSLPPKYYYIGEDNHLVTHSYRGFFLTYSSLKQPTARWEGSTKRKQQLEEARHHFQWQLRVTWTQLHHETDKTGPCFFSDP